MKGPTPDVSVVIPTFNREGILEETLAAISVAGEGLAVEVLVVNDGDSFSRSLVGLDRCVVLDNRGQGAAAARNLGASKARSPLLLFLDDDMLLVGDNIRRHVALHAELRDVAISGIWHYNPELEKSLSMSSFGRYKLKHDYRTLIPDAPYRDSPTLRRTDSLASFNLSLPKRRFDEIHGFNPAFKFAGCEDQELSIRLRRAGLELLVATDIVALHNEKDRVMLSNWLERQYRGVQGVPLLAREYPDWSGMEIFTENGPISRGDGSALILRKAIKFFFYNMYWGAILMGLFNFLDRLDCLESVRHYLIRRLEGIRLYMGLRKAYASLTPRDGTGA